MSERAALDQRRDIGRCLVIFVPGIVGQPVFHRLDDMGHRIQPDHIRGAEGGAGRAPDQWPCDGVGFVQSETESLGMMHHCEQREHADAVGDEVRRVERTDHAFAKRGGQETLQIVGKLRVCRRHGNDFDQRHVARRIEEMHAAEARTQGFRQRLAHLLDGQARGIGGNGDIRRDVRRNALI